MSVAAAGLWAVRARPDRRLRPRRRAPCPSRLRCDLDNLRQPEFLAGLRLGLVALAIGLVAAMYGRRRRDRAEPLPGAGLLLGAATLEALRESGRLVGGLALGVGLVAVGGLVAERLAPRLAPRAALSLPGAYLLFGHSGLANSPSLRLAVAGATVVGAALIPEIDARGRRGGLGPLLFAVSVVGLYEAEPDPDLALVLLGVALPLLLLGWPRPLFRLGDAGCAVAVALLAWTAAVGGTGRPSAVIGSLGCLGLLLAEPVYRLLRRRAPDAPGYLARSPMGVVGIAGIHLVLVYVSSRVASFRHDLGQAVAIVIADLAVGAVVLEVLARSGRVGPDQRMVVTEE